MKNKLRSIYEYISDYSEEEIDAMISELAIEEQLLLRERYGEDLHHPCSSATFNNLKSYEFYEKLVPKMKRKLKNNRLAKEKNMQNDEQIKEETEKVESNVIVETNVQEEVNKEELESKIIDLLNQGFTNNEICETLKIDESKLYNLLLDLKNNGTLLNRKYYSNGTIKNSLIKTCSEYRSSTIYSQNKAIITEPSENLIKVLVISDLHLGNKQERLDLINRAYNYCIKNGMHIILIGGDLIDGNFTQGEQFITSVYKQIEYLAKNYPYDKSILNIGVAGDHDLSAFNTFGLNIIETLNNYRQDIAIGSFNNTGVNIKNDQILLYHPIINGNMRNTNAPIILEGHHHKYKGIIKNNQLFIDVPSLSDIILPMPTALELDISFKQGYISNTLIKQIYFGNEDIILNEYNFDLSVSREGNEPIRNVENYRTSKNLIDQTNTEEEQKVKTIQPISQIDKFNKRYGL